MMTVHAKGRLWRSLPAILVVAIVALGVTTRVRFLRREMMSRWHTALEGGALTTQATVDDWFSDRDADAEALATSISIHAAFPHAGDSTPRFATVLAPIVRRAKFTDAWVVDSAGNLISAATSHPLRADEVLAAKEAIAKHQTRHSAITANGPNSATIAIAAPVKLSAATPAEKHAPAAVILRADLVKAFAPWARGRPNAAMSMFATPAPGRFILISACPEQSVPVCIEQSVTLSHSTPAAIALAQKDSFGLFNEADGHQTLALTRFDKRLGWGVIRRVSFADAQVPLDREFAIEGAFLLALLGLLGLGGYAANRTVRVRRLYAQHEATVRLSAVVDASTDGIISLDEDFAITMVNAAVERMLGYSSDALVGRPIFALFAAEWHAHLLATLEDFARSSFAFAPLEETERCIALCSNGALMPVDARVSRAIANGVPVYVMGLRDVSERARTENFLKGQRLVLEMIARGAPAPDTCHTLLSVVRAEATEMRCAIYELDVDREVAVLVSAVDLPTAVTSQLREQPAGPRAEGVGLAVHGDTDVISADVAVDPRWSQSAELLVAHGIHGAWAIPLRAADGTVIGALACYFDATRMATPREQELAHAVVHLASIAISSARDAAQLRLSEASFRSFVENTPAAIFRETRGGDLQSTNQAMVELLGYPNASALQSAATAGLLYIDADARSRLLQSLERDGVVRGVELEWRCAAGPRVAVRVSARAYRDEQGLVVLWEGYAENVTSLRHAQEALRRSEKLAAVGQLISGVAHELNNPLSSIMHFTEDLLTDDRPPADAEALGVIRDQARRSRAIVRDLLSFVRQRESNAEPTCLTDVVAATVRGMGPTIAQGGVLVLTSDDPERGFVLADRAGIEQIVTNVVANAVQAAARAGGGEVRIGTRCDADQCELVVEDNGPGIPDEVLPRIFDPFFTTKQTGEGTGLGLSVTLGIVEQLGGRIGVEPRAGGSGTRFVISLPRMRHDAEFIAAELQAVPVAAVEMTALQPVVAAPAEVSVAPRTALIIDDEPSIRAALRRYFTRRGWVVEDAADGDAALQRIAAAGERLGVVVCDLRMPGLSGIDLHDRLARERPALLRRFVFSTGDVASAEAAHFVQRTLCPVLQKPFELRMLDDIIARVVEGADAERVVA